MLRLSTTWILVPLRSAPRLVAPTSASATAGPPGRATEEHATESLPESRGAFVLGRFKLRAIEGPDRVAVAATFKSTDARTVIGTAESADLRLTDPTVSRFHCEIVVGAREVRVRDLGSTNHTGLAPVRRGSPIRVGPSVPRQRPRAWGPQRGLDAFRPRSASLRRLGVRCLSWTT
jgi:pSer/pThr/pTyr-binding forkhead associated (FHA) protein